MKIFSFLILFFFFQNILCDDDDEPKFCEIYNLTEYGKLKYSVRYRSITVLELSNINEEDIYLTYEINNTSFEEDKLMYIFSDVYPDDSTSIPYEVKEYDKQHYSSYNKGILINETKIFYKIKKEDKKYLLLDNLQVTYKGDIIEIEHILTPVNTIVPAIICILSVIIQIFVFIFLAKRISKNRKISFINPNALNGISDSPILDNDKDDQIKIIN